MTENNKEREVPLGELADDQDELDWNIERDGRFRDYVAEPPKTTVWMEDSDYGIPDDFADKIKRARSDSRNSSRLGD